MYSLEGVLVKSEDCRTVELKSCRTEKNKAQNFAPYFFSLYFVFQSTFQFHIKMEKPQNEHLETLAQIRSLMERSSRFISLSGLSGVAAGTAALLGAMTAFIYLGSVPFENKWLAFWEISVQPKWGLNYQTFFLLDSVLIFLIACVMAWYFTNRRAKQQGLKTWDPLAKRMLINLAIPLVTGGIFCLALYRHHLIGLIAPATLIFYGLALVNGGKYTVSDIRSLGITQIILGIIGLYYPGYGLELWALGFGVLHIVYGVLMYRKYEV